MMPSLCNLLGRLRARRHQTDPDSPSSDGQQQQQQQRQSFGNAADISTLCERLAANDPDLVALDLSGQRLDANNALALGTALRINENLCMLNVGDNNLGNEGTEALLEGLQHHSSLEYLFLCKNGIGSIGILSDYIATIPNLKWVDLSDNNIKQAKSLFQVAASHPTLEVIDLSVNNIGDADAEALGGALQNLQEMNLFANTLGDSTCLVLEQMGLGSVRKLNLGYNRITNAGGRALLRALSDTPNNVKDLVTMGNGISSPEVKVALQAITTPT